MDTLRTHPGEALFLIPPSMELEELALTVTNLPEARPEAI